MTRPTLCLSLLAVIVGFLPAVFPPSNYAQSHSLNGQIEGTVVDQNGAAIGNAIVAASNIDTGFERTGRTNENGVYRFPLLPLGSYRISVEAAGFRNSARDRVALSTGQLVTVDFALTAGNIAEVVTVSAGAPMADQGKTDIGRVVDAGEVRNLPLVSRNPYNFAFLQANVNGATRSDAGGFPRINANGYARRVNYLLDGNTNTQADRAGVRLLLVSETLVSEVQLITNAFSAEFGNTPGLIMNLVTPSGTNGFHGTVSYRFARTPFYSRPFFYSSSNDLPENDTDIVTGTAGGPIVRDRWHFTAGYEWISRDDNITRPVSILPSDRDQLIQAGLPASIFVPTIPVDDHAAYYFLRSDLQIDRSNHLTVRFNHNNGIAKNLIRGDLNTLERSTDTKGDDHSAAVQLASCGEQIINEFRFQYARRWNGVQRNEYSGSGPSIVIRNVASFGSPEGDNTINPLEKVTQFQNNLTLLSNAHAVKIGGGVNFIDDMKRSAIFARYAFPSIDAYVSARNGVNLRGYTTYEQTFGDPEIRYRSRFWNLFVQDDWKVSRRLKVNLGLRYDLYQVPEADAASPYAASRKFNVDKNNFAPRLAAAYAIRDGDRPVVLRFGSGVYYETPWLNMYERALLNNGDPKFTSIAIPASLGAGAPAFPTTLSSIPHDLAIPVRDIDTVSPDFQNMYAVHANVHYEHAITKDMSATIGFAHSSGRHLAVYRNVNVLEVSRRLADGRPVFSPARADPRFNVIRMAESVGNSEYNAFSLQVARRLSRGIQFNAAYTLSKATDDAPEQNLATPPFNNLVLSDPTDRSRDRGHSFADQRHTFIFTSVIKSQIKFQRRWMTSVLNNNQIAVIAMANSGERFNIISGSDLNADGISSSDRPVGIRRNSGTTPPQFNVDLRYSRFFAFTERVRLELFCDVQNVFNVNSILSFANVNVTANPSTGELVGPLPDFRSRGQSVSQESRQAQVGVKFHF